MPIDPKDQAIFDNLNQDASQAQQLRQSMGYGLDHNPDQRARTQVAASANGVNPAMVEGQESAFEKAAKLNSFDFDGFIKNTPVTADWMSQPENAAVAHDDLYNMTNFEKALGGHQTEGYTQFPNGVTLRNADQAVWLPSQQKWVNKDASGDFVPVGGQAFDKAGFWNSMGGWNATPDERKLLYQLKGAPSSALADLRGVTLGTAWKAVGGTVALAKNAAQAADQWQEKAYGKGWGLSFADLGIPQGLQHLQDRAQQLVDQNAFQGKSISDIHTPGDLLKVAATLAGGVAPYMMGRAALPMFLDAYGRRSQALEAQGNTPGDTLALAATAALPDAAIGLAHGEPGFASVLKSLVAVPAATALAFTAKHFGDTAVDEMLGIAGQPKQDETFGEFLQRAWKNGGADSAMSGYLLSALPMVLPTIDQVRQNKANGTLFEAIQKFGENSKLVERLPQAAQDYVKRVTAQGPVDHVEVAPEAIQQFYQTKGLNDEQTAQEVRKLGVPAQDYMDSLATGDRVVIPIDKFTTQVAPNPELMGALKDDFAFRPGESTNREMVDAQAKAKENLDNLEQQTKDLDQRTIDGLVHPENLETYQKIKDDVKQQLAAIADEKGKPRFSPQVQDMYATLAARGFVVGHDRAGIDPAAEYPGYKLNIFGDKGPEWVPTGDGTTQPAQQLHQTLASSEPPKGVHFDDLPKWQQDRVVSGIEQDIQNWSAHPEEFDKVYEAAKGTYGGRLVNGDIMRQLLPTVARNVPLGLEAGKHTDGAIESKMVALRTRLVDRAIDLAGDKPIGITAGGQSSGKTTIAEHYLNEGTLGAVIDAPHDNAKSVQWVLDKIHNRNKDAEIVYVDRPNFQAAYRSMIERAIREGRMVDLQDMIDKHLKTPSEILKVGEANQGSDRVGLNHAVNSEIGPWDIIGGKFPDAGKDAMSSILNRATPSSNDLVSQAKEAYLEYQRDVQHGSAEPIPADTQRSIEASFSGGTSQEPGVAGGVAEGHPEEQQQAPAVPPAADRLRSSLQSLGISPDGDVGDIRRKIAEAAQDPAKQQAVRGAIDALRENEFYQTYLTRTAPTEDDKQGSITFGKDGSISIALLKKADTSTFLHEMTHMWVKMLANLAGREDANPQVKEDFQKLLDAVGAKDYDSMTVDQQEQLARMGEKHFMEGKAPSADLQSIWSKFGAWMRMIKGKLSGLGVELSPEVKGVFDRLYATDKEIGDAHAREPKPLFATAADMGMAPSLFKVYQDTLQKVIDTGKDTLRGQLMDDWKREYEEKWQEERGKIHDQAMEDLGKQPIYRTHDTLVQGKTEDGTSIKLNRKQLVDRLGEDAVKALEREHGTGGRAVYTKDGMDLDTAAEVLNEHLGTQYASGDDLAQQLHGMEPMKAVADRLADAEMKNRHGDKLTDGTLHDAADEAIQNRYKEDALVMELKAIRSRMAQARPFVDQEGREGKARAKEAVSETQAAKDKEIEGLKSQIADLEAQNKDHAGDAEWLKDNANRLLDKNARLKDLLASRDQQVADLKGQDASKDFWSRGTVREVPPLETFRTAAANKIQTMAPNDLTPSRYLDAGRKASRGAFAAMAKDDYAGAAEAKQKEILNHFLYKEAVKAQKTVSSLEKLGDSLTSTSSQKRLGLTDQSSGSSFKEQINNLLSRYGLTGEAQAPEVTVPLSEWVDEQTSLNRAPTIDPTILNEGRVVDYKDAPMSEIQALKDALVNIRHLARQENTIRIGDLAVDREQMFNELHAAARGAFETKRLQDDPNVKKTFLEGAVSKVKSLDAMLMRMEQLVNWMDKDDVNGPWHTYLWNPIAGAEGRELDMTREITAKLQEAMENMPKEQRESLLDKFQVDGLDFQPTRKYIISALFNMGNEQNREKMIQGMGWADKQEVLADMFSHLNAHDAKFVQDTWDTIGSLWPHMADLDYRMTGLEPVRVQPQAFRLNLEDGEYHFDGGYYPLKGHPIRSRTGAKQEDAPVVNLTDKGFERPNTITGHLKARTGATYPLLMDFERILGPHVTQAIQDITHREAVMNAYRIISDPGIRTTLSETMGEEYMRQFLPWLKSVVNDRNQSASQGLDAMSKWMSAARRNTVSATMGYKLSTALVQYTGITRSLHYCNAGDLIQALGQFVGSPKETTAMVHELSAEMRNRAEHLDRDYREMMQNQTGQNGFLAKVNQFAFHGIAMADQGIGIPTWLAAFNGAVKAGKDEPTAILEGDRAVRLTQPTAGAKDLPAVMRSNDFMKLVTMFYGHFSVLYQNLRDAGHQVNGASDMPKFAARVLFSAMIPAVAGEFILNRGAEDDEDKTKWALMRSLHFASSSIPLLRDVSTYVTNSIEGKESDYRFSPVVDLFARNAKMLSAMAGSAGVAKDDHPLGDTAWKTAEAIGYDLGIPGTSQAMATGRYLAHVQAGDTQDDAWEATKHVAFGYHKKK